FVFGDANNQWLSTRQVWNEHAYHVTNVNDDASIPVKEAGQLSVINGFRAQAPPLNGCAYAQPDIVPSFVRQAVVGSQIKLTVRIGNSGGIAVGSSVPVSFYNG